MSTAITDMPPVSLGSMRSVRRTLASMPVAALAPSTGRIRRIIATASSGSFVSSPRNDWPGETVSMFVPSRSRTWSSDARLASEIARTATIAAMPIAIPIAVSDERSLRAARPRPAIRASPSGPGPPVRSGWAGDGTTTGPGRVDAGAVMPPPRPCAGPR